MIENALCCEVVEARLLWLEFKADQGEGFAIYHANRWEGSEGPCCILKNLEIYWSVTCVQDLHSLVYRFIDSSRREAYLVRRAYLDHGNERLGTRWE